jgi:hypothetical protein
MREGRDSRSCRERRTSRARHRLQEAPAGDCSCEQCLPKGGPGGWWYGDLDSGRSLGQRAKM